MEKITPEKLIAMQQAAKQRYGHSLEQLQFYDDAIIKDVKKVERQRDLSDLPWRSPQKKPISVGWQPPKKKVSPSVSKKVIEDKPKPPIKRPLAIYSNIGSPFGLHDELKKTDDEAV